MLFEQGRAQPDGHLDGVEVIRPFVGGVAHFETGVALFEQFDLVQLQILVAGRILAHAVHDGEGPLAMAEETDHLVDVFELHAGHAADDRQLRFARSARAAANRVQ